MGCESNDIVSQDIFKRSFGMQMRISLEHMLEAERREKIIEAYMQVSE